MQITRSQLPKPKPEDESQLGFGKIFTDHMLTMVYDKSKGGWQDMQIRPYAPFSFDPALSVLHYGQSIFEGLKAYRDKDNRIRLFRPKDNLKRFNRSARRMCMPEIDEEAVYAGLCKLMEIEKDWVPRQAGTSLYIRPAMIAADTYLGVSAAQMYVFFIILSPVGAYYPQGFKPVNIYVEDQYVRAVQGGTGDIKTAANYAASLYAGEEAKKKGYSQVLWLDGKEHKYVEEVGSMNIMFRIGNELVTPELQGSILPGITRDSVLQLCKDRGIKVTQRRIAIDEVIDAHEQGLLKEVFGTGTAAVISPVGEMCYKGKTLIINNGQTGEWSQMIYTTLTGIQYGELSNVHDWSVILPF